MNELDSNVLTGSLTMEDASKFARSQSSEQILYKKNNSLSVTEIATRRIEISRHQTNHEPEIKEENNIDESEECKTNGDNKEETVLTM